MTGLTMCSTMTCPLRNLCLRFMAPPSLSQSWSEWKPKGKSCPGFISLRKEKGAAYPRPSVLASKYPLSARV